MSSAAAYEFRHDPATGLYQPFVREQKQLLPCVAAAQPGPQLAFMQDDSTEIGICGTRGSGKTEIIVLKILSGIGRGWGSNYSCVLLRSSLRELTDITQMIETLARPVWGRAMSYNKLNHVFEWKSGEKLELNYLLDKEQAKQLFMGKQFAIVAVEELTLQKDLEAYLTMFACLRGPLPESVGFRRHMLFSCNAGGPSHNAVAHRFGLSGIPKGICGPQIVDANGETRRMFFSTYFDNTLLRRTSPNYISTLMTSTEGDEPLRQSWVYNNWSIVSGGAMDAIFFKHADTIFIDDFEIPATWRTFASFDLGSTRPWAWLAFAESDGTDFQYKNARVGRSLPGDLFLVGESYGWTGVPDKGDHASIAEITARIQNYKIQRGWRFQDVQNPKRWHDMFRRNYADDAIGQEMNGYSAQEEFKNPALINGISHPGIEFQLVSKPPGSRETGFALVRERLINTAPRPDSKIREGKGLFIVRDHAPNAVRTLPVLSRNPKNSDDVDPACESHIFDAIKYALAADRAPKFSTRRRWIA
jgi:hypothetical protein